MVVACQNTFMHSPRNPQQEDISLRVMRILQANPDITQRELAQQLGISLGGLTTTLKHWWKKAVLR
jgi:DNA-binding Lrp family transcriptional regulator